VNAIESYHDTGKRRVLLDVSVLLRYGMHTGGIVRVVRELARRGARSDEVQLVFFDTLLGRHRFLRPDCADAIIGGAAYVDLYGQPERPMPPGSSGHKAVRKRWTGWLRYPRRCAIVAVAGLQWRTKKPKRLLRALYAALLNDRYRKELAGTGESARLLLPFALCVGPVVEFAAHDILVYAGTDWSPEALEHVTKQKAERGFSLAIVCYDTIPILYPEFYQQQDAEDFQRIFFELGRNADLVLVTARQVASDVERLYAERYLARPRMSLFRPGADLPEPRASGPDELPDGLRSGNYALFVSTLEPRKGHRMLFRAWKQLLAAGVPQAHDFKLVFVGRRGWLLDDVVEEIQADDCFGKSLFIYSAASDRQVGALYRNAAFGLFPSLYEGYGLPVVELFHYGKAVIASSGGALREVVGEFSLCLDPKDAQGWYEAIGNWITNPSARASFEEAIRSRFVHPSWDEAADSFFRLVRNELSAPGHVETAALM
jgi:glycosyltransferase involved in cell wall biosynthesis